MKFYHQTLPLCIVALFAFARPAFAGDLRILDDRPHHLGLPGEREWRDLDADQPENSSLSLTFQASANPQPATLFIRQRDVKLRWPILLNGRKLGALDLIEYPEVATIPVPAGALRDGENSLSILSPEMPDDIFVEGISLDARPLAEACHDGSIRVRATEKGGREGLPCRITIADARGALAPVSANPGQWLAVRAGVIYTGDGEAVFGLPAGEYTIYATRGFEYGVAQQKVTVRPGSSAEIALEIGREVSTPQWVACDPHVHTFTYSKHGDATAEERVLTLAGEGVELAVASDHNVYADYSDLARRLKVADDFTLVLGDEVTTAAGHFIAFPIASPSAPLPDARLTDWPALMQSIRGIPGVQVVILNHPRDTHNGFVPFAPENFDAATGRNLRGPDYSFDAIEVCNSGTLQSDFMRSFRDWFALLNHGDRVVAVGSSDSHDVSRFIVGQGRTYIAGDDAHPGQISVDEACRNLRAGRACVSMGLLTRLTVNDRFEAGDLATSLGNEIRVTVRVFGPTWVEANRVELYANGLKIREQAIAAYREPGEKARIEWRLPRPAHDTYLVAIASGPGVTAPYWPIPFPYQPTDRVRQPRVMGANNPVWLDADGDGKFTSARGYARAMVDRVAKDALQGYDDAVIAQVQALNPGQDKALPPRAHRIEKTAEMPASEANQAAAADERFVYAVDNAVIGKYDRETGRRIAVSSGEAKHLNSGFLWKGRLYCAHSNFPRSPAKSEIMVLDPETMVLSSYKDFGDYRGSLTWCVYEGDSWWCTFAHYGADNAHTVLVKLDAEWREVGAWTYPPEVIRELGSFSISGGVWKDGLLLATGHDERMVYRLKLPAKGSVLEFIDALPSPFPGQGLAIDTKTGGLVGIDRKKRTVVFGEIRRDD